MVVLPLQKQKKRKRKIVMTSKFEIKEVSLGEKSYPPLLAMSSTNPPQKLYYIGNLPDSITIACIGIRKPTEFGTYACNKITEMLINNGFTIVSGMALGIDTVAHKTAIKSGGHTVAVLASGLNTIYPKENEELFQEIIETNGCIISEYPEEVTVTKQNLVSRNRIITGLSLGTICMQAKLNGGSIRACKYALAQLRPLFFPMPPEALKHESESEANILFETNNPLVTRIKSKSDYSMMLKILDSTYMELIGE